MIRKIFLALIGVIIAGDLIFMGISFSSGNKTAPISKNLYTSNNDSAISSIDARTIVENKAQGGTVTSLAFDKSKNQYDATVETLNSTYSAIINGSTGNIESFINDNKKPHVDLDFTPNSSNNNGANLLSASKAVEILNKIVPDGKITELTYNIVSITPQYDANIIKDNVTYHVAINASNGDLISNYS